MTTMITNGIKYNKHIFISDFVIDCKLNVYIVLDFHEIDEKLIEYTLYNIKDNYTCVEDNYCLAPINENITQFIDNVNLDTRLLPSLLSKYDDANGIVYVDFPRLINLLTAYNNGEPSNDIKYLLFGGYFDGRNFKVVKRIKGTGKCILEFSKGGIWLAHRHKIKNKTFIKKMVKFNKKLLPYQKKRSCVYYELIQRIKND